MPFGASHKVKSIGKKRLEQDCKSTVHCHICLADAFSDPSLVSYVGVLGVSVVGSSFPCQNLTYCLARLLDRIAIDLRSWAGGDFWARIAHRGKVENTIKTHYHDIAYEYDKFNVSQCCPSTFMGGKM